MEHESGDPSEHEDDQDGEKGHESGPGAKDGTGEEHESAIVDKQSSLEYESGNHPENTQMILSEDHTHQDNEDHTHQDNEDHTHQDNESHTHQDNESHTHQDNEGHTHRDNEGHTHHDNEGHTHQDNELAAQVCGHGRGEEGDQQMAVPVVTTTTASSDMQG